jgi:hypothetical protein
MLEETSKPYMSLEYVNEWGDRTVVEYESLTRSNGEAAWFVQNLRGFMAACGFPPGTVEDYLPQQE